MESTKNNQPNFIIQKIYTKDISFEVPTAPDIFQKRWQDLKSFMKWSQEE